MRRISTALLGAAIALPACSGGTAGVTTAPVTNPAYVAARHFAAPFSAALQESAPQKLFVSTSRAGYGSALIFDYPSGQFVGNVPPPPEGLNTPAGECIDVAGNVYITNPGQSTIDEYTGQGQFVRSLPDPGQSPINCSVSFTSGDLAAVNDVSTYADPASVSIFRRATGSPIVINSPYFFTMTYIAYDNRNNVFLDGSESPTGTDEYGEIPSGESAIEVLHLHAHHLTKNIYPEALQFAAKQMAIGSLQQTIYRALGHRIVGHTHLTRPS